MISIYKIKPAFQKLLQPLLKMLYKAGITANQLTIAAVFLSAAMGLAFLQYQQHPVVLLFIPLGYLLRMGLNALDGMMATQYNMKSKLGEILNELGDVISDIVIVLPFMILPSINPLMVFAFVILSIINEYAGILGKAVSGERRYEGPMGKSDRAFVIGLFCLIFFFNQDIELYANWIFGATSLLIIVSTIVRLKNALK